MSVPFTEVTDVEKINQFAFEKIKSEIQIVNALAPNISRGVLILGEAGSGKTHLLARVYQRLSYQNFLLFVSNPSNPEGIYSFIWHEIVRSLKQNIPNSQRAQGEDLLRLGFASLLRKSLQTLEPVQNEAQWNQLIAALEENKSLGDKIDLIRNRLKNIWTELFDGDETHKTLMMGLFNYLVYKDYNARTETLHWLTNYDSEGSTHNSLMRPWTMIEENTSGLDYCARRENWALKAIRVITTLANYSGRTMILAFDQLEAMNGNLLLTRRWGEALKQIMDECHNIVVVTCVFPRLWKEWFTQKLADGMAPLDEAAADRIAASQVELQTVDFAIAKSVLHARIKSLGQAEHAQNPSLVFSDAEIRALVKKIADRPVIRTLLTRAHEAYQEKVGSGLTPKPEQMLEFMTSKFKEFSVEPDLIEADEHIIKRLEYLLKELYQTDDKNTKFKLLPEQTIDGKVFVPNLAFTYTKDKKQYDIILGICNKTGQSLTARLKNWKAFLSRLKPHQSAYLLQYQNTPAPSPGTQGATILNELKANKTHILYSRKAMLAYFGLHGLFQAILERELEWNKDLLKMADLRQFYFTRFCQEFAVLMSIDANVFTELGTSLGQIPKGLDKKIPDTKDEAKRPKVVTPPIPIHLPSTDTELKDLMEKLKACIREHKIPLDLPAFDPKTELGQSPQLLSLQLKLSYGASLKQVTSQTQEISLALKRKVRILKNIQAGGITLEIARKRRQKWTLSQAMSLMPSERPEDGLLIPLGMNTFGQFETLDISSPPHILVSGTTGSGKSNFLQVLVASLVSLYGPKDVEITILDAKEVDYSQFTERSIPHIRGIISDHQLGIKYLGDVIELMKSRQALFRKHKVTKIDDLRRKVGKIMNHQVIVIDEAAEFMDDKKVFSKLLRKIAAMGRATGVYVVMATQYPKVNVIPNEVKVNLNNRLAFKLHNAVQSRVVIDEAGAEHLIGHGDCLVRKQSGGLVRVQVPEFDEEILKALNERFSPKKAG